MKRRDPKASESLPEINFEQGISLLEKQLESAKTLLQDRPLKDDKYSAWELVTRNFLEKTFGKSSSNVNAVLDVGKYGSFPMNAGEHWWESHRAESLEKQITKINGLIELLKTEIEISNPVVTSQTFNQTSIDHKKVFIVHGRDEGALHAVARFVEKLNLTPIILREQPNSGRTIIEKFSDYSDVGFAIILLTPDDKGGLATEQPDMNKFRARQNVILELGFFLGKLSRNRVCALYVPGVEIPSDYQGVLFVQLDQNDGWKLLLAKELKAVGIDIDMNKAL